MFVYKTKKNRWDHFRGEANSIPFRKETAAKIKKLPCCGVWKRGIKYMGRICFQPIIS
ncbi:hypothetical protein CHISP_2730 [Chitinispirillum alkaliphilum]|nr:hypothetical protein CHISP_2730 [Chitinispirillum alkaliphilum]